MSKIIVGVDESAGSADAIALASSLAGMTGATLMLVNVFPYDVHPSRAVNYEFEAYLRQDSTEMLERLRSAQATRPSRSRRSPNPSSAHGLHALAENERRRPDRRRLHAYRPRRPRPPGQHRRAAPARLAVPGRRRAEGLRAPDARASPAIVGCGYDGSAAAQRALDDRPPHRRARPARGCASSAPSGRWPTTCRRRRACRWAASPTTTTLHDRASAELDAAVAKLEGEPRGEPFFAVGDAAEILADGVRAARPAGPRLARLRPAALRAGRRRRRARRARGGLPGDRAAAQGRPRGGGLAVRRGGTARPRLAP